MNTQNCRALLTWYSKSQRQLPWRQTLDPYSVMVSEFMLQQTTVAAVTPKYHAWMNRFPGFQALAQAEERAVLSQWSGLGYYQRARRLHDAAREIVKLGSVPDTYEGLLQLPGIGPYTAAAIASICFGRPKLAVDTNVVRVLFRYYALEKPPQDKPALKRIRSEASSCLQSCDPGVLNQALMELGATVCSVRDPGCLVCPLASGCAGRTSEGGPTRFPLIPKRKKPVETPGTVLLCVRSTDCSVLLVKGTSLGLLSPLFQPPIYFRNPQSQEPHRSAFYELSQALSERDCSCQWSEKYGISGRRLRLQCSRWDLDEATFTQAESILKDNGLQVSQLSPSNGLEVQKNSLPVSSLTRTILKKCWEIH